MSSGKKPVVVGVERPDGTKVIAEFDSSVTDYFKQRIKETAKPKPCPKCKGVMQKVIQLVHPGDPRPEFDLWYCKCGYREKVKRGGE